MDGSFKSMQQIALLIILLFSGLRAQPAGSDVQTIASGQIDWDKRLIKIVGRGQPDKEVSPAQYRLSGVRNARRDVSAKLISILQTINLTSDLTIGQVMGQSPVVENQIRDLAADFSIKERPRLFPDSSIQITAELPLTGKLLKIIQPAITFHAVPDDSATSPEFQSDSTKRSSELIVDIRGLGCGFALYPRIFAEDGTQLYGPAAGHDESGHSVDIMRYISASSIAPQQLNGIIVKGVKSAGNYSCDVIISDKDANALMTNKEFSTLLNRGKLIFLVE